MLISWKSEAVAQPPDGNIWVTGYYAGWMQGWENYGLLPAEEIDYSALTHIIHFSLVPRSDGTLDSLSNSITEVNSRELVTRAHQAGIKVIISVGGWGTDSDFRSATSPVFLERFINNLVGFMERRGYDGIDIDWEYLSGIDAVQYGVFITQLRARLNQRTPRPLLTAAVAWQPSILAPLADDFDQINVMTYDLSGAWPGWISWHNAPIYDGGIVFPSTLRPVPSAHGMVSSFQAAGIPIEKLGIGIDFYGYVWSGGEGTRTGGVTEPTQLWTIPPFVRPNIPYYRIWEDYYSPEYYRWDSLAQASFLRIDQPGALQDRFVSYDDRNSCREKIAYAREQRLGGVFIWELGGGYLSEDHPQRDHLLQAVKSAAFGTNLAPAVPVLGSPSNGADNVPPNPVLTWQSPLAGKYRVQISEDSLFTAPAADDSTLTTGTFRLELEFGTTYFWRVAAGNSAGWSAFSIPWKFTTADSAGTVPEGVPAQFALHQNFPNPFNGSTSIQFDLPQPGDVLLEIWTLQGEIVATLINGRISAGTHRVAWNPVRMPSGTYFCRIRLETDAERWNLPQTHIVEQLRRLIYVK